MMFISHDLAVVKYICDHTVVLKDGSLVEAGESQALFRRPSTPYLTELIASVPRSSPEGRT